MILIITDRMAHLSVESVQFHNVQATKVPAKSCENRTNAHDQHENMLSKLKNSLKLLSLQCQTLIKIGARIERKTASGSRPKQECSIC